MLDFKDYIERAFYASSKWNVNNAYFSLTRSAQGMSTFSALYTAHWIIAILDFKTPKGFKVNISSLATPHFGSSYGVSVSGPSAGLGSIIVSEPVCGYMSYLFSSIPLSIPSKSALVPLSSLVTGYNHLLPLPTPEDPMFWEVWHRGRRVDTKASLFFGRVFLPKGRVEGLYMRRTTPTSMIQIRGVSDDSLRNGGNLLGILHRDVGRYSTEISINSDSALL
jgi:mitochondrial distribution and morphology protein 10